MRKRIWAVLLTICMLVGLLPTTALADEDDVNYSTFDSFKAALEDGTDVSLSDCSFTWPETNETIQVNGNITASGQTWNIPANITLVFPADGSKKIICYNAFTLTIHGTVKNENTSTRSSYGLLTLQTENNCEVIIADGGRVEGGFYIDDHETWTVENGGTLAANVMLGGTLQGNGGTVTGTVTVNNLRSSWGDENWTAHLSGNLTLGGLQLYSGDNLIIPSGSQITLGDEASLDIPEGSQLNLKGGLTIGGGYGNSVAGTIAIGESGTLTLPQDSALFGGYVYNSDTQESEEVYGQITGNGTIKAYATKIDNVINGVPCVWNTAIPEIVGNRTDNADLVAESVTIWCSWTHNWDEGAVTKEATCTEPGEKTYTCTDAGCGDTMTEVIPVADHTYGEDGICTACGASKSETGAETCSITLNYNEALCTIRVIDGNTQSSENPTVFVTGNGQSASVPSGSWIIFEIFNIQEGYRIGSATLNGTDRTQSFVNGAYGGLGISNISTDYTLTAVMEEIPATLPSVTSVTLYTDLAGTQPAAENITYTSESTNARLYGKAAFSDGVEYPVYYAMGQWQFSTDGTTWQNTSCWGRNRFDFWPGWQYHEELDFLNASYDIRLKVIPQDLYTTGDPVYSNVIHINGGASGGTEEEQYSVSNICFRAEGADHPMLVWDCTPAEDMTCSVYVTYDSGAEWELFESEIADAVCDIMEPGMDGVNGIKIEMADANGTVKATDANMNIQISAEETTKRKDLTGTVSDAGDDKNFSWTISGFSENTLVWVNFTDADGSIRSGLANVSTGADGSLSGKTPYGLTDHDTDNVYIGEAYEYGNVAVQDNGKTLSYTMTMVGEKIKLSDGTSCDHAWDEGVITTPPTLDKEGVKTFTCTLCRETKTEAVPKLEKQTILLPGTSVKKTYGDADFSNEATNKTAGGGALTYSSSNTAVAQVDAQSGKVTIVGAGDAVITVTAAAVENKYAETSATYTVTVAKAPLTITAKDKAIAYGEKAANDGYTVTGFVKGEDESVLSGEAVYSYTYKQYGRVGTYDISVSGLTAQNYDITFVDGNLTVGQAEKYAITLSDLEQLAGHVSGVTARIDPYDTSAVLIVEYEVGGEWTTDAPQDAGEYSVRASLTDSDNIVVPDDAAYTTGTLTVKPGVTVDTGNGLADVDVAVTVNPESGTAEITVTKEDLTQIAENANGQVSIDLGTVSDVDTLVLPGNLVEELSKSEKAESLTVSTENASVTLSASVLDTVANTVTGGEDTVSVRLESVTELNEDQQAALNAITTEYPVAVVDVSLVVTHADGNTDTLHELGGDVTVTVPYDQLPGLLDGQYVVACYISDDGTVTYLFAQADEKNRTITFTTSHFSYYAVCVSGKPTAAVAVDGGSGSGIYLEGDTVTIKADSKSGYTFAGWEIASGDVKLADAKAAETTFTMPGANVELTATYTKNSSGSGGVVSTFTLTFDTNGGSAIASVSKASGTAIDLTGYVPTREGYDFDGWYADAGLTDKITSVKLTKNMTVYAKWTEKNGETPFTDVSGDAYYADAVIWAVGEGITSGTTATTFAPDNPCTRAQAVTFLWRAAGSPVVNYAMNFSDVSADAYYAEAVRWAVSQGITMGTSDTAFSPNAPCTRAQIVTFLWRSQQSPAAEGVNPFTDVAADAYYAAAVLWAAEKGITSGTTATNFSPNATCTRAQIVTFLYRAFGD